MVTIVPFDPAHLDGFEPQDAQRPELAGPLAAAAEHGPAFAAIDHDGRVLAIAGLAETHARHATAWALFAPAKRAAMVAVTRACARVIHAADYDRVDMFVRAGFDRAADFALLLGFELEATLRRAAPDGSDFLLFARINVSGRG